MVNAFHCNEHDVMKLFLDVQIVQIVRMISWISFALQTTVRAFHVDNTTSQYSPLSAYISLHVPTTSNHHTLRRAQITRLDTTQIQPNAVENKTRLQSPQLDGMLPSARVLETRLAQPGIVRDRSTPPDWVSAVRCVDHRLHDLHFLVVELDGVAKRAVGDGVQVGSHHYCQARGVESGGGRGESIDVVRQTGSVGGCERGRSDGEEGHA